MDILELLAEAPVIAAAQSDAEFSAALSASPQVIFWLNANILSLPEYIAKAHACGKVILVHIDLAEGLGKDPAGVRFLHRLGADGLISTRSGLIRLAKESGLCAVQRFFMVDSHSMVTAQEAIRAAAPDLVELMPGIAPKIVERFRARCPIPVIAGGLIDSKEEILAALRAGAAAVSTGKRPLWDE